MRLRLRFAAWHGSKARWRNFVTRLPRSEIFHRSLGTVKDDGGLTLHTDVCDPDHIFLYAILPGIRETARMY